MNTPKDKQPSKSSSCDASLNQSGVEKLQKISRYPQPEVEALKLHLNDKTDTICSDTWTCFQELGASAWQQSSLGEYRQLSLWKSTPTRETSCDRSSQMSQFTQTSETTSPKKENSTSSQWDFPARVHPTQEVERDSSIQLHLSGEKVSDALSKLNPASVLLNNLKEFSDEDLELFLADSVWQDTITKLKQSRRESLVHHTRDSDCLSFPTLTSGDRSTSRPAGQTKCEKWFKDKGLIPNGSQLGSQAIAQVMGFPSSWFEGLTEQYSKNPNTPSQTKPQAESEQGIWQEEQLPQDKQRSLSEEFSTSTQLLGGDEKLLEQKRGERSSQDRELSIPCIIKQPKQPEVKGVIRKDKGDRFLVEVDGDEISVSKLFVYPDFSKSVGQIEKNPRKKSPPSKNCSRKTRRQQGEGSGAIFYRTVTTELSD